MQVVHWTLVLGALVCTVAIAPRIADLLTMITMLVSLLAAIKYLMESTTATGSKKSGRMSNDAQSDSR